MSDDFLYYKPKADFFLRTTQSIDRHFVTYENGLDDESIAKLKIPPLPF